jgi:hypothetical protein
MTVESGALDSFLLSAAYAAKAGALTQLALLLSVPITIAIFSSYRPSLSIPIVYLGSLLFLPERINFDFPLVPPLDKESLPTLTLFICALVTKRAEIKAARMGTGADLLTVGIALASVGTVLTNPDPLQFGPTLLPGLTIHDSFSEAIRTFILPGIPFLLARTFFRTREHVEDLLKVFVVAGLIYFPFILIELRFSPQMHNWIYGFAQHDFIQTKRGDGYRPMVFMSHGLALSMFVLASLISAVALARAKVKVLKKSPALFALVQTAALFLMKSLGTIIYGIVAGPVAWFFKPKGQIRVAVVLAVIVLAYPFVRPGPLFPRTELVDYAAQIEQDRARSLEFRFRNEDELFARTLERPIFGWAGFSRGHIFDQQGIDRSVVDGGMIGVLNRYGFAGFVLNFWLMLWPVFVASWRVRRFPVEDGNLLAATALITSCYAIDLLPNGFFNNLPFLFAGVTLGLAQGMLTQKAKAKGPPGLDPATLARVVAALQSPTLRAAAERRALAAHTHTNTKPR